MINRFPNGTPKQSRSKEHPLRKALLTAIAAATFANSGAQAAEKKPKPLQAGWASKVKPEHKKTEKELQPKKSAHVREIIRTPTHEDAASKERFAAFSNRMQGVHLEGSGPTFRQWQYEEFCREFERYCRKFADSKYGVDYGHEFSPQLFALIDMVNRRVNADIRPITDIELHKVRDKWTMADAGDCEEFVLKKMDELITAGLDPAYMHILIVGDQKDEGHAVLGVDVFRNGIRDTLILDNLVKEVIPLSEMEKVYTGRRASFLSREKSTERLAVHFYEYRSKK